MKDRLQNLPVLLSASVPESVQRDARDIALSEAITSLVQRILSAGGQVVFGGHPSIVPLVHRAARDIGRSQGVVLYLLSRFRDQAPSEVEDSQVFSQVHWIGDGGKSLEEELIDLREAMIQVSRAAVFMGGKTEDFIGPKPGIRDEYERFTREHRDAPVYLLGFLDGETGKIIGELEQAGDHEPNALSETDRDLLHGGVDMDRIAPVLVADLERLSRKFT